jgi:hypothetical protein
MKLVQFIREQTGVGTGAALNFYNNSEMESLENDPAPLLMWHIIFREVCIMSVLYSVKKNMQYFGGFPCLGLILSRRSGVETGPGVKYQWTIVFGVRSRPEKKI